MTFRLDFDEISRAAAGRWGPILSALGPFKEPVDAGFRRKCKCPMHNDKGKHFRMYNDFEQTGGAICNDCGAFPNGFKLLAEAKSMPIRDVFQEVAEYLGMTDTGEAPKRFTGPIDRPEDPKVVAERQRRDDRIRQKLNAAAREAVPLSHPDAEPARSYLRSRKLDPSVLSKDFAFHRGMEYFDDPDDTGTLKLIGVFPVLLATVRDANGAPVVYHRTFLTPEGKKAPVRDPKRLMSLPSGKHATGGAIRIVPGEDSSIISLAEGLETSLAVLSATGLPVWSCVSAPMLSSVVLPERFKTVLIWADLDNSKAGQVHADDLAHRLLAQGRKVFVFYPPGPVPPNQKSVDWLDAFSDLGVQSFPASQLYLPKEAGARDVVTPLHRAA